MDDGEKNGERGQNLGFSTLSLGFNHKPICKC